MKSTSRLTICTSLIASMLLFLHYGIGLAINESPQTVSEVTPAEFREERIVESGTPQVPLTADLDNDGDLDLLFLNVIGENEDQIAVLEWQLNHRATFTTAQTLVLPGTISGLNTVKKRLSISDVDGDGFLDVMMIGYDKAWLFANDGGTLSETPVLQIGVPEVDVEELTGVAWGDVDRDGDDDLLVSSHVSGMQLYKNVNGTLESVPSWISAERYTPAQFADINHDGFLDLVTQPPAIFLNQNGILAQVPAWEPIDSGTGYQGVVVEDFDGNGLLDVATQNGIDGIYVYTTTNDLPAEVAGSIHGATGRLGLFSADIDADNDFDLLMIGEAPAILYNDNGTFDAQPVPVSDELLDSQWLTVGDIDGNGTLDIVQDGDTLSVFFNEMLGFATGVPLSMPYSFCSSALGDYDGDGDLDAAFGDSAAPIRLYRNDAGEWVESWVSAESFPGDVLDLKWVDFDNDGDLDLSGADFVDTFFIHRNDGTKLEATPAITLPLDVASFDWGDVNRDGFPDLIMGDSTARLFLNMNGSFSAEPDWTFDGSPTSRVIVTLEDTDNDGDLDILTNEDTVHIFENENGTFGTVPHQTIFTDDALWSDLADLDLDGDVDLVTVFDSVIRAYHNTAGTFATAPFYTSAPNPFSPKLRLHDVDADGDVDLTEMNVPFSANAHPLIGIYANDNGTFATDPQWDSGMPDAAYGIDFGDVDLDGVPDMVAARGCSVPSPNYVHRGLRPALPGTTGTIGIRIAMPHSAGYRTSGMVLSDTIAIPYTLYHPGGQSFRTIQAFYSLNGGGDWQPAIATSDTLTRNLPINSTQSDFVFNWDVNASGFFGESDSVVIRIEALPAFHVSERLGGVHQPLPKVGAQTPLMRVRGTQVQVTANGEGAGGAQVLRRAANDTNPVAQPIRELDGTPRTTAANGFLDGRGVLAAGDQLVALLPVDATDAYTLYHTSAPPTPDGVLMQTVTAGGVQALAVSAENPLMLFNFDVSLEWDARTDPDYLDQLQRDLRRTSEILFDLTNGQAALGNVNVYQDRERWIDADIVVKVDNTHRPNANLGGVVSEPLNDTLRSGQVITNAIAPGQIRMGAIWNRYGNPSGTIGEDWPRVLAHEIGHYAFFQIDNYFGLDPETGLLVNVDCQGSVMTDAYREEYTEFLTRGVVNANDNTWDESCENTLAEQTTGRSDWETVRRFYPFLQDNIAQTGAGPSTLPLGVTQIKVVAPTGDLPVEDEFFFVTDLDGSALTVPEAETFRIIGNNPSTPLDDKIIPLGAPIGQLVQARGARLGDSICVYDSTEQSGCTTVTDDGRGLELHSMPGWEPAIEVRPAGARTLAVTITQSSENPLTLQFYPQLHPTRTLTAPIVTLTPAGGDLHTATVEFPITIFSGHLRLWEDGAAQRREMISDFAWVPGWSGSTQFGWGGSTQFGWGGSTQFGWGGSTQFGWGGNVASVWFAPVASQNGQVTLLNVDNIFGALPGTILQRVQTVETPEWLTPVGEAYRYLTDREVEDEIAIQFRYLERNLPVVEESQLRVYFRPNHSTEWQRLNTVLNTTLNLATAATQGDGHYALMATIELPAFDEGWNSFGYPILESRPITTALGSIQGKFTSVYHESGDDWLLYDTTVDIDFVPHVNTLHELEFARTYWLHATEPVTGYLGIPSTGRGGANLPATYYGRLNGDARVGDPITLVTLDEQVCGATNVIEVAGLPAYVIQATSACADTVMRLSVAGRPLPALIRFNNRQAQFNAHESIRSFIPLIRR